MRENSLIKFTQDGEVIEERYLSAPLDIIAAFGCDFHHDKEYEVENYAFEDERGCIAKLYVEFITGVVSIAISDKNKQSILFFQDQHLTELRIIESKNAIKINTKFNNVELFIFPQLNARIESNRMDHPRS